MKLRFLLILAIVVAMVQCAGIGDFVPKHHEPASISKYEVRFVYNERFLSDKEFIDYVFWKMEGTSYLKIKFELRRRCDGSGDSYLFCAVIWYERMVGKKRLTI